MKGLTAGEKQQPAVIKDKAHGNEADETRPRSGGEDALREVGQISRF